MAKGEYMSGVKFVKREGKWVLPSNKIDWSKSMARSNLMKHYGDQIKRDKLKIGFGKLRNDGTRMAKLMDSHKRVYVTWSYLTDIGR
jgi:hypothetical protein